MHIFRQLNDERGTSCPIAYNLNQQGNQLKDPNNWDGPLAERFRNDTWPGVENTLRNLTQELTDLREQLNQISTDIFQAGGGS